LGGDTSGLGGEREVLPVPTEDYGKWMRAYSGDSTGSERIFDELASGLSGESISRRRALRLAGASLVSALGLAGFASPAEAAPTCPRHGAGCATPCKSTRKFCFCIRIASGERRCVWPCCSGRPCQQCHDGEVCMINTCCGPEPTCVRLCSRRRPNYCRIGGGATTTQSAGGAAWS
jgi:hypothetical protein